MAIHNVSFEYLLHDTIPIQVEAEIEGNHVHIEQVLYEGEPFDTSDIYINTGFAKTRKMVDVDELLTDAAMDEFNQSGGL